VVSTVYPTWPDRNLPNYRRLQMFHPIIPTLLHDVILIDFHPRYTDKKEAKMWSFSQPWILIEMEVHLGSAVLLRNGCFTEWPVYKQVLPSRSGVPILFNLLMAEEGLRLGLERFLLKLLPFTTRSCISQADVIGIVVIRRHAQSSGFRSR
jgi:hypothetical protein